MNKKLMPRPKTYMFNTFFSTCLQHSAYDFQGVRNWLQKAGQRIADVDLLIVPINLNDRHWVVVLIDIRKRCFFYMDSIQRNDFGDTVGHLRHWLMDELTDKIGGDILQEAKVTEFSVIINPKYTPHQLDGGSCGVFVLSVAENVERGKIPDFKQEDIPALRQHLFLV